MKSWSSTSRIILLSVSGIIHGCFSWFGYLLDFSSSGYLPQRDQWASPLPGSPPTGGGAPTSGAPFDEAHSPTPFPDSIAEAIASTSPASFAPPYIQEADLNLNRAALLSPIIRYGHMWIQAKKPQQSKIRQQIVASSKSKVFYLTIKFVVR